MDNEPPTSTDISLSLDYEPSDISLPPERDDDIDREIINIFSLISPPPPTRLSFLKITSRPIPPEDNTYRLPNPETSLEMPFFLQPVPFFSVSVSEAQSEAQGVGGLGKTGSSSLSSFSASPVLPTQLMQQAMDRSHDSLRQHKKKLFSSGQSPQTSDDEGWGADELARGDGRREEKASPPPQQMISPSPRSATFDEAMNPPSLLLQQQQPQDVAQDVEATPSRPTSPFPKLLLSPPIYHLSPDSSILSSSPIQPIQREKRFSQSSPSSESSDGGGDDTGNESKSNKSTSSATTTSNQSKPHPHATRSSKRLRNNRLHF